MIAADIIVIAVGLPCQHDRAIGIEDYILELLIPGTAHTMFPEDIAIGIQFIHPAIKTTVIIRRISVVCLRKTGYHKTTIAGGNDIRSATIKGTAQIPLP